MADTTARNAFHNPYILPLHFAPEPWTGLRNGGLHPSKAWPRPELIITKGKRGIRDLINDAIRHGHMNQFLRAINSLQATLFTINVSVLNWTEKYGLTTSEFTDLKKFGKPKKRKEWWPGSEPHSEMMRQKRFGTAMAEARIVANGGRFFVPLHADWRGRIYGICDFWFGREDYICGLFLFADGERIGEEGLLYLKAHVARCADGWHGAKTKHLDLEGRAAWTDANLECLYDAGDAVERCAPISDLPSDPIQIIAACLELKRANNNPNFITHLPISFDGTCSGLQHLSALTRCEDEGRLCNLIPGPREDLYQVIADKTGETRKVAKALCVPCFYGSAPGNWEKKEDGSFSLRDGMIKILIKTLKDLGLATRGGDATCARNL